MIFNKDEALPEAEKNYIHPRRLTMIQMSNNCMFCENPQGVSYITHVVLEEKMGYIYCKECMDNNNVNQALEIWNNYLSFGEVHYLKDCTIRVERSPKIGDTTPLIEGGWKLYNPITRINRDFEPTIHCYNERLELYKWCLIETIMRLNPKEDMSTIEPLIEL